jgi:hypothetical protein
MEDIQCEYCSDDIENNQITLLNEPYYYCLKCRKLFDAVYWIWCDMSQVDYIFILKSLSVQMIGVL